MAVQCKTGTAVLTVDECKKACEYLGISNMGNFKEGRPCYKGRTGVCNQNIMKPGSRASRICKGIEYKYNPFHGIEMIWIVLSYKIMPSFIFYGKDCICS